jgi:hypothetical protein
MQRQYPAAIETLQAVNAVDPEDVEMHYTLMLCDRGIGNGPFAEREEQLARRFKVDESSQSITETRRHLNPEGNNELQSIHHYEGAPLGAGK